MSAECIPVRQSHLIRHCSVGAIVRGVGSPSYLMVVGDIRQWTDRHGEPAGQLIRYVDGVRSALGIDKELRKPPVARRRKDGTTEGVAIPAWRFPSWMRCPGCGHLFNRPWKNPDLEGRPRCVACPDRRALEQVTWVMVHPEGYMADVPWHFLAHRDAANIEQRNCRADWEKPYLVLEESRDGSRRLRCTRCDSSAPFEHNAKIPYGKNRAQPWVKETAELDNEGLLATILEVNDTRIHRANTTSALVIPPESRIRRNTPVDRLYGSSEWMREIGGARSDLEREGTLRRVARALGCAKQQVEEAWEEIGKGYPLYGQNPTVADLIQSEFSALATEIPGNLDDEDLVTDQHSAGWKEMASGLSAGALNAPVIELVDRLIAVRRLKEIQILKEFSRMEGDLPVPPDIVGESKWLPAIELFGEGIFFTLDERWIADWEKLPSVERRTEKFKKRFVAANLDFQPKVDVSARFLLLHTLSHLLIRQVEAVAGYPAASLKERLYCSSANDAEMAGVLVYVAVPDVAGSLGGLAELAEPRRFLRLLTSVFEHAGWCSLDPVCGEHEGQGPRLLNRAACHACALIPEPCCVCGNLLLDRCFIKGASDEEGEQLPALLDYVRACGRETQ